MFTPISALVGGALIGLSASLLLAFDGRVAGISGIIGRAIRADAGKTTERGWRLAFLGGLAVGAVVVAIFARGAITPSFAQPVALTIVAGLFVGVGTQLGNGCTSGHGVCGISRLSKRSIIATCVFMVVAMLTTFVVRHLLEVGS